MNLAYTGDDDQIVKKIEAGNVSLPLNMAVADYRGSQPVRG